MPEPLIDRERCISCGECVADCPANVFIMEEHPVPNAADRCIGCQHCLAVCPTAAVSFDGVDPDACRPLEGNLPDPGLLATLIKGRRSVRRYKDEDVDTRVIDELVEIASHAPTGVNARQVLFTVVADRKVTEAIRAEIYDRLEKVIDMESPDYMMRFMARAVKMREKSGYDTILRHAPHLLVASAPSQVPTPEQDCLIALATFDLAAQSMGIGTVWNGLLYWVMTGLMPDFRSRFSIPDDHVVGFAMSFGHPAVQYQRTVERGPARLNRVGAWTTLER
jgi:nitroreductase/NAD-dependent dihydropyrimidine dehydrogenase PreA subunit